MNNKEFRWLEATSEPHNVLYDTNALHITRGGMQLLHSRPGKPTLLHKISRDGEALERVEAFCMECRSEVQLYAETGGLFIAGAEHEEELLSARYVARRVSEDQELPHRARRIAQLQADIFDLGARLGRRMETPEETALERRLTDGIRKVMQNVRGYVWDDQPAYANPPSTADIRMLSTAISAADQNRAIRLRSEDGWHAWVNTQLQRVLHYSGVLEHVPLGYTFDRNRLEIPSEAVSRVA